MSTEATTARLAASGSVLSIADLKISFATDDGVVEAVKGIGFDVKPGEIVAVVGESGSGKSVTSMSVLGLLPRTSKISGDLRLDDRELVGLKDKDMRRVRGNDIAMIFQEPMSALNPVYTVGWQIREALRAHQDISREAADKRALELLDMVGIPNPVERFKQYPHQLSGGLRQRVVIAMAIACDPKVIIADEPTTALDVTVQAEILGLLRKLRDTLNTAIVLITHDMGVVADLADRVVVMYQGEIVEQAPVHELFASPREDYTKRLLAAVPVLGQRPEGRRLLDEVQDVPAEDIRLSDAELESHIRTDAPALEIKDLVLEYPGKRRQAKNRAVDGVSLHIDKGEILGLVGESGSGKSTVGRCAIRLLKPTEGTVSVAGRDITNLSTKELRPLRRYFSIVFQDPASTLDPKMTIGESIAEPMVLHKMFQGKELNDRVVSLLDSVELSGQYRNRYPHELSGGQRQRVSIARALALDPHLLIADEPTSALDVSVQARVLDLFLNLQQSLGFACLFISHDLAVVDLLADRVAVMQRGKLVEVGERDQVLHNPQQEYTRRLLSAAPVADPVLQAERRAAWEAGKLAPVAD
ncbi:peptide/nickel transport system ATP-binding protein [Amycolatopsis bartoniae]|uniref:ABC transporter ATP-binding protein n=1 Tax=Amycolatopsis bartoniae TaxID=941986 RepID=UPI00118FF2C6|nr:ABC transporter ATP-binding protein [Amycolatopsis bartoniae]MBB2934588.1 peptide/nickel transport system ATP-binding protein [Amycolatopsis bartoniae]TVT06917.1 ABC transporter ATP-binding protein [Amycolatopsis bartoniae]